MVLPVTEDTPPDMLAGSMDLRVVLPDGHMVKMSVERSTPMMDLLVQVTTLNKIAPAGHVLQAMGEHGLLPYKPNTPIGALEAWTIHIVPKNKAQAPILQKKAPLKPANQQQPFEQTFRLQVHLPRNQLYVMRVSPRTLLCDILRQTCSEKNLDPSKYEMRHPADLSQLLSPSCSLADYRLQEVTVVARSRGLGQALSSSDIMALQREEDKRRQVVRQQQSSAGLSLVFNKRSRSSVCEGSISSDSLGGRSISPARSDESASRSASPPAPVMAPPTRPARKRRPAPKPPAPPDRQPQKQSAPQEEDEEAVNVSHSRNSSDSSGYHEASVLSDGPADLQHVPDTLPRRNKTQPGLSRSMSSLTAATSTTSLTSTSGQKKKKAPPPPPANKTTSLERHLSGKSSSQPLDKCSTLPGKMKMSQPEYETNSTEINHVEQKQQLLEENTETPPQNVAETAPVEPVPEPAPAPVEPVSELSPVPAPVEFATPSDTECEEAIDQVEEAFSCVMAELDDDINFVPPPPATIEDAADDWQYELPAPPTAFRDASSPTLTERETVDLASAQVYAESEVDLNRSVTRTNPLFIAQEYDTLQQNNESKSSNSGNSQESDEQSNEIKSRNTKQFYSDRNSREYSVESNDDDDSKDSAAQSNDTKSVDCGQQMDELKSTESKQLYDDINSRVYAADDDLDCREYGSEVGQFMNGSHSREQNNETERSNERESRSVRSNELSNFTITTYQRPLVSEEIYAEGSDDEKTNFITKPTKLYLHQKFNSTTTLNSNAANLSRTNSLSDEEVKQQTVVKRSTSHISLSVQPNPASFPNKTKSVSNLASEEKEDSDNIKDEERERLLELQEQFLQLQKQLLQNSSLLDKQDAPLQSLQVLRSILPQLGQQQQVRTGVNSKSLKDPENSESSPDRRTETQNAKSLEGRETNESVKKTSVVTVNTEKRYVYRGPPAVNFTTWSERPKSQVSIKMDGDYRVGVGQSNQKETRNKTVEVDVSRPAVSVSETKEPGSSAVVELQALQHNDPSRVPIVRSVELKKSFIEQQNLHKSTTLLNGGGSNGNMTPDQRSDDDCKFVGVNSLAKRFSAGVRPVSAYGRVENAAPRKYTSVVGIGADSETSTAAVKKAPAVVRVNGYSAPKHLMPVVKGFQFAAPAANKDTSGTKLQRTDSTSAGNKLQRTDSTSAGNKLPWMDSASAGNKLQRTDATSAGNKLQRTDSTSAGNKLPWMDSASAGKKLQRTDSTSVGNKLQRSDSTSASSKLQDSLSVTRIKTNQSEPPRPPPITTALKKSVVRPKTLPVSNPRDELMNAIRNFGGRENLRQQSPTQDNVMVIR